MLQYMSKFVIRPLRPLLRIMDSTMRPSAEAGVDVARLATNDAHPDERGIFTLLERDESSAESMDQQKQDALWVKSAPWVGLAAGDTALALA